MTLLLILWSITAPTFLLLSKKLFFSNTYTYDHFYIKCVEWFLAIVTGFLFLPGIASILVVVLTVGTGVASSVGTPIVVVLAILSGLSVALIKHRANNS